MTVVTCGRTHLSERSEAITRSMREAQGFALDIGCGRAFDLNNVLQHIQVYRCLECARWLCRPCIVAHFEETSDAYRPTEGQALDRSATDDDTRHRREATDTTTDQPSGTKDARGSRIDGTCQTVRSAGSQSPAIAPDSTTPQRP